MENQTSLKAGVAELELEAVIGFNGEASSVSGLGGLQAPGTNSANGDTGVGPRVRLEGSAGHWPGPSSLLPPGPRGVPSSLQVSGTRMASQHLERTRASSPGSRMSRVAVTFHPMVSSTLAISPRAGPRAAWPLGPRNS